MTDLLKEHILDYLVFEAMTEQKLKIGTIITYSDENIIEQNGKKI